MMTSHSHWISKAPGSLMLFGEHAVLHGKPAIACAIDHWLEIHWELRDDNHLEITTDFAQHSSDWQRISPHPKLTFVMTLLQLFQQHYGEFCLQGLTIHINSGINSTQGLGSSSAVVAALVTGLARHCPALIPIEARFKLGLETIRQVQGTGSGTDLAVALAGGVIQFDPLTQRIERLNEQLPIISIYSGYKMPTPQVIGLVEQLWPKDHPLLQHWLEWITTITLEASRAITRNQLTEIGRCMNMAHGLMHGLGVSDPKLDQIAHQLRACKGIFGAKISGSGLGDCVIGLGQPQPPLVQALAIKSSSQGAHCC